MLRTRSTATSSSWGACWSPTCRTCKRWLWMCCKSAERKKAEFGEKYSPLALICISLNSGSDPLYNVQVTHDVHYENFRSERLAKGGGAGTSEGKLLWSVFIKPVNLLTCESVNLWCTRRWGRGKQWWRSWSSWWQRGLEKNLRKVELMDLLNRLPRTRCWQRRTRSWGGCKRCWHRCRWRWQYFGLIDVQLSKLYPFPYLDPILQNTTVS